LPLASVPKGGTTNHQMRVSCAHHTKYDSSAAQGRSQSGGGLAAAELRHNTAATKIRERRRLYSPSSGFLNMPTLPIVQALENPADFNASGNPGLVASMVLGERDIFQYEHGKQ